MAKSFSKAVQSKRFVEARLPSSLTSKPAYAKPQDNAASRGLRPATNLRRPWEFQKHIKKMQSIGFGYASAF
jgi:hypothetical protein